MVRFGKVVIIGSLSATAGLLVTAEMWLGLVKWSSLAVELEKNMINTSSLARGDALEMVNF